MVCRSVLFGSVLAVLPGCAHEHASLHRCAGPTMGASYEVQWRGAIAAGVVEAAVAAELAACDACFSQWRDDSEIARFNRRGGDTPFAASDFFCEVLQQALAVAAATDGAFDPTVKPLTDLWRAAKADPRHSFDDAAARRALANVGHHYVRVHGGSVTAERAGVALDLDGIAAGACADAIAARLDDLGIGSFHVDVTGEVRCRGEREPGVPWRIAIGDARRGLPARVVAMRDCAICTSGVYENTMVAGGRPRHHVFDPRTGDCADNGVVSATVIASTAALADALATAFLVLGEEGTARVLSRWPAGERIAALLLVTGDDGTLREVELEWPR